MSFLQGGAQRVAVLAAIFAACAPPELPAGFSACSDPRPQMCTKEYRPVCGHRCEFPPCPVTQLRSYGNSCDACADPTVGASTPGRCESGPSAEPPLLR